MKSWEKINSDQSSFDTPAGRYFQYKAVLLTEDISSTPELLSIEFIFNEPPEKPVLISPENEGWVIDSNINLTWEFSDSDIEDYQTAVEVNIAFDENFDLLIYYNSADCTIHSWFFRTQ